MFRFLKKQRFHRNKNFPLHLKIVLFTGLLSFWLLFRCSNEMPTASFKQQNSSVAASITFPKQAALTPIDSLRLDITGEDIESQNFVLSLDGTTAFQKVTVPSEKEITFTATAFHQGSALLRGQRTFTAKAGENTELLLIMEFLVPAVILTPPDSTVTVGDTLNVVINVRQVEKMARIGVLIEYPPNLLNIEHMKPVKHFLLQNARDIIPNQFSFNNAAGQAFIKLRVTPASAAPSGDGKIARITFRAQRNGMPDIQVILQSDTDPALGLYDENDDRMTAYGFGSRLVVE